MLSIIYCDVTCFLRLCFFAAVYWSLPEFSPVPSSSESWIWPIFLFLDMQHYCSWTCFQGCRIRSLVPVHTSALPSVPSSSVSQLHIDLTMLHCPTFSLSQSEMYVLIEPLLLLFLFFLLQYCSRCSVQPPRSSVFRAFWDDIDLRCHCKQSALSLISSLPHFYMNPQVQLLVHQWQQQLITSPV